jgi:hypothetical protein
MMVGHAGRKEGRKDVMAGNAGRKEVMEGNGVKEGCV